MNKLLSFSLASFFLFGFAVYAQEPANDVAAPESASAVPAETQEEVKALPANTVSVSGTISEIAADGTYLIVNDGTNPVKFSTTKDFIDEAYMEVGDKIKATAEKSADGLKLLDYDYIFDDAYEPVDAEKPADEPVTPTDNAAPVLTPAPAEEAPAEAVATEAAQGDTTAEENTASDAPAAE